VGLSMRGMERLLKREPTAPSNANVYYTSSVSLHSNALNFQRQGWVAEVEWVVRVGVLPHT